MLLRSPLPLSVHCFILCDFYFFFSCVNTEQVDLGGKMMRKRISLGFGGEIK